MLKIMTMNINYYVGKHGVWPRRRELICQAIRSAQPDIIALQAVESNPEIAGGADQARQLAQLLTDYSISVFYPAQETPNGDAQGSAWLSRLFFRHEASLPLTLLPGLEDTNHRVLLAAELNLATGQFHLINAHLSWVKEQARANVGQILPFINSLTGPALLVGDLNNTADSAAMQAFRDAGWTDVWARLHPGENGFTFESNDPTLRIDYAWANSALLPSLRAIEIIADETSAQGARASDHRGLLISLDLNPRI